MKNVVLIVLLASVSVWSIADNHGGSGKGRKGGLFKQMDADGDGKVTSDEMKQRWKKRHAKHKKECPLKEDCSKSKDCPMKEDCPYNKDCPKRDKK